uniref:Uncharacterized protein n=1 Tax=Chromera velia CCMP2878 TaxID=1169474 RepID=A0A0G4HUA5_9ALVE|eukprot:Cvel_8581.t1-p1 / transcript=Cvel_8581.t1 / gene=Cvel_8581 / organism=Chromera_velia_CCMP2878 / gene_product=hypothetical protein / transcript_product=hypothetical protein / location=Cvel_scaffold476:35838-38529(+) / protein_length=324 / sequence_SO=supercontig / SO=protein_coding / is_pseudo=false
MELFRRLSWRLPAGNSSRRIGTASALLTMGGLGVSASALNLNGALNFQTGEGGFLGLSAPGGGVWNFLSRGKREQAQEQGPRVDTSDGPIPHDCLFSERNCHGPVVVLDGGRTVQFQERTKAVAFAGGGKRFMSAGYSFRARVLLEREGGVFIGVVDADSPAGGWNSHVHLNAHRKKGFFGIDVSDGDEFFDGEWRDIKIRREVKVGEVLEIRVVRERTDKEAGASPSSSGPKKEEAKGDEMDIRPPVNEYTTKVFYFKNDHPFPILVQELPNHELAPSPAEEKGSKVAAGRAPSQSVSPRVVLAVNKWQGAPCVRLLAFERTD